MLEHRIIKSTLSHQILVYRSIYVVRQQKEYEINHKYFQLIKKLFLGCQAAMGIIIYERDIVWQIHINAG